MILTVAPAISNRGTGINDWGAQFAELSATLDITLALQWPKAIAGAFRPARYSKVPQLYSNLSYQES